MISFFLTLVLSSSLSWGGPSQSGSEVFFPDDLGSELKRIQSFPATWTGVIILPKKDPDLAFIQKDLCDFFEKNPDLGIQSSCKIPLATLRSWVRDLTLRSPLSLSDFRERIASTKAQMSLLPSDSDLFAILQMDPLGQGTELLKLLNLNATSTETPFIAITFNYPPNDMDRTDKLLRGLPDSVIPMGPHFASALNRSTIIADVKNISTFGVFFLIATVITMVLTRTLRGIAIVGVVLISGALANFLSFWIFGSIHGLTLAFSSAIVGLSLDYGFHRAFVPTTSSVWKSNFLGLGTTLVVLMIVAMSEIPLIRQLMVTSILGLIIAFGLYYALYEKTRLGPEFNSMKIRLPRNPFANFASVIFFTVSVIGFLFMKPDFNLSSLEYVPQDEKEERARFSSQSLGRPPLFSFLEGENFDSLWKESHRRSQFAEEHQISSIGVDRLLPSLDDQETHRVAWREVLKKAHTQASEEDRKIFAPFWKGLEERDNQSLDPTHHSPPEYLRPFVSDKSWLTIWRPAYESEERLIQKAFPDTVSLRDLYLKFPEKLQKETQWMFPVAFLLVMAFILLVHRKAIHLWNVLIPFSWGFGFIFLYAALFANPISFVSLIGMLIIFGVSIDYGVFSIGSRNGEIKHRIQSALLLSGFSTGLAVLPLIFCHHPILRDLGQTLLLGTMGTLAGTTWGYSRDDHETIS